MTILEAKILTKFHPIWSPMGSSPHTNTKASIYSLVITQWKEEISKTGAHKHPRFPTSYLVNEQMLVQRSRAAGRACARGSEPEHLGQILARLLTGRVTSPPCEQL